MITDKRLKREYFFISHPVRRATCYNYKSQHKHYIVLRYASGLKLYSTNGVSYSGEPKAVHRVIEGVYGI